MKQINKIKTTNFFLKVFILSVCVINLSACAAKTHRDAKLEIAKNVTRIDTDSSVVANTTRKKDTFKVVEKGSFTSSYLETKGDSVRTKNVDKSLEKMKSNISVDSIDLGRNVAYGIRGSTQSIKSNNINSWLASDNHESLRKEAVNTNNSDLSLGTSSVELAMNNQFSTRKIDESGTSKSRAKSSKKDVTIFTIIGDCLLNFWWLWLVAFLLVLYRYRLTIISSVRWLASLAS